MTVTDEHRESRICNNMGLVHACVRRFLGRGMEYDDLFQAGCLGLIKAADAFDEERGLRFSTYAVPVILGEIRRLFRDGGTVKVSRGLKELALKVTALRERYLLEKGREPTVREVAERLDITPELAVEALGAALPPLSLTRNDEEDSGDQIDVPVDTHEKEITDRLALQQVLGELTDNDRTLIESRFFCHRTQQATADLLGMTQVQVSRRERAILAAMREKLTG